MSTPACLAAPTIALATASAMGSFVARSFTISDTGEQALATNVADDGMLRHQALEAFEEAVAHLRAVFEQVFTFDDFDVGQSRGGTGRAAAEGGGDVAEVGVGIGRVADEVLEDLFRSSRCRRWEQAGSDALSHRDDVGLDVEVLVAEPLAGTAKAVNDFVDDQEQFVLVADLADGFIVASRGTRMPPPAVIGSTITAPSSSGPTVRMTSSLLGHLHAEVGAIAELGAVDVAVGEFIETGSEGTVLNFTFERPQALRVPIGAVVVTSAVQDAGLLAAVLQLADLTDDLESLFVGF